MNSFNKEVCPDSAGHSKTQPGGDLIGIIVRHGEIEEAIISRMAAAVAKNDKDEVFALAAELVAFQK